MRKAANSNITLRLIGGAPATRALHLLRSHQTLPADRDTRPVVIALVLPTNGDATAGVDSFVESMTMAPTNDVGRLVQFGDVTVDLAARAVTRLGEPVTLTPRQFDLLAALVRSGGRAMSRRELIDVAWPDANGSGARTIDTHIWHLRHRLERDAAVPRHIMTVKKMGYRFQT
jgi:DNA-binding response OmpR family regulator